MTSEFRPCPACRRYVHADDFGRILCSDGCPLSPDADRRSVPGNHIADAAKMVPAPPARSAAVARLVEACQMYLGGSKKKPKADQRIDILLALAAVEKEIGQ